MSIKQQQKKSPLNAFLPAIGFILVIAFAAIAIITYQPAHEFLVENIDSLPQEGEEGYTEMGYVVGFVIFLILVSFSSMLYAIGTPKKKNAKLSTEKQLRKEKEEIEAAKRAKKRRRKEIQRQMIKERQEAEKAASKKR